MDSKTARKIKAKNTYIEMKLGKAIWSTGLRYRKHCKDVFGHPDFCFRKKRVAIFCDSEFWHGKKFLEGERFKTNVDFWEMKIKRNIERDLEVNERLKSEGWTILRFWGSEIKNNVDIVVEKICNVLGK